MKVIVTEKYFADIIFAYDIHLCLFLWISASISRHIVYISLPVEYQTKSSCGRWK